MIDSQSKLASYHLEVQPTTFDFANWLCVAKTLDYKKMSFVGKKFKPKKNYPDEIARARLENLIKPLAKLANIEIVDGSGDFINHFQKSVHMVFREVGHIWKFPYQKRYNHMTITLRESFRNKYRDSDRTEWEKFANWAENNGEKIVFIEDNEDNHISVEERWDKYQCKFNWFTGGGPSTLCQLSDAPYVMFERNLNQQDYYLLWIHHWTYTNSQLPWSKPNQRIIWGNEKFDKIVRAYERIANGGGSHKN